MDNASISHYHQPEAFIVFLWLVCLSLTLSGKPHLAAVKTVCGVFCELADNVALQTEIAASSQRGRTPRRRRAL